MIDLKSLATGFQRNSRVLIPKQLNFIKVDQNKSECSICAKDVVAEDGNPANLILKGILIWITREMEKKSFVL